MLLLPLAPSAPSAVLDLDAPEFQSSLMDCHPHPYDEEEKEGGANDAEGEEIE